MIFKPALVHKIVSGSKTQTRRPAKDDDKCRYEIGKSYAVQPGCGKAQVARIVIAGVRLEDLRELTFEDARREGFRTRAEFARYWLDLYSKAGRDLEGDDALDYFERKFGGRRVWVIDFELDKSEVLRFLHRNSEYGYTSMTHDAMADDVQLEAVDDATLLRFGRDAQQREAELRDDATISERRAIAAQIDRLEEALEARGDLGVKRDLRVLRATLRKIDQKLKAA